MKNAVRNLIAITGPAPSAAAAKAAALALAKVKDPEGATEDAAGRIVFTIEWEPAFKDVKELSTKHKDVTFTLYGDAFAKQHWISKTVYLNGKATVELALSRIDGQAFRDVYQEVFGEAFVEKKPA